jgi:xylan 1,4-beta-xylosidase
MAIELRADRADRGAHLAHFWSKCVGAGRANEGLRASWQEQLRQARAQCGFEYIRFHGLYHDDMFVYREDENGEPVYNFQYVDELFDKLLEIGIRPFVEFGFCPGDLATVRGTVFWWKANGSPPKDYGRWAPMVF